ncbi:MAG TPA: XRE family transcriptional regulator, partial [Ruminococcaceae bacterium]|nr:XRE family transcriptional regulator [Oscillospiraceae bacterium]
MKRYNEIIKELREEKGVSTLYIAELLKTSQSSYEKYEAGLKELSVRELV